MTSMTKRLAACVALAFGCAAQAGGADGAQKSQQAVWDAAMRVASKGPVDVPLLDQAVLHLPAGEVFVPQPQADELLALFGNPGAHPEMPGLILPRGPEADWYMQVLFHKVGHVPDDEARTWNVDAMMAGYRAGTADENVERVKAGQPEIEVVDWVERPGYDAATRRLVWAMSSRVASPDGKAEPLNINYNTHVLGRDGYFSLSLVTGMTDLPALKALAAHQLDAIEFMPGRRYADFDPRTDHVARMSLSTLVVGERGQRGDDAGGAFAFLARHAVPLLVGALAALLAAVLLLRRRPAPTPGTPNGAA